MKINLSIDFETETRQAVIEIEGNKVNYNIYSVSNGQKTLLQNEETEPLSTEDEITYNIETYVLNTMFKLLNAAKSYRHPVSR